MLNRVGAGYEGDDDEVRDPGQQVAAGAPTADDEPLFAILYNRAVNASVLFVAQRLASHTSSLNMPPCTHTLRGDCA
jgi:hypothetical protein